MITSSHGGRRGRLVSPSDRQLAVTLIGGAKDAGARSCKACEVLKISTRTFRRWGSGLTDRRSGT